jgi:hypothetical protein
LLHEFFYHFFLVLSVRYFSVSLEKRFDAVCLKLCVAVVRHASMLVHMSCLLVRVSEEEFSIGVLGKFFVATVHVPHIRGSWSGDSLDSSHK